MSATDDEFDRALQALAALQIKHGVPAILMSTQGLEGDVVTTLRYPQTNTFGPYARIRRSTNQIVRLRS